MERSHLQPLSPLLPYQSADTFLHFACRFIGEGKSKDIPRLVALLQQESNFIGQHACLTRASTSYYQLRPVAVLHSSTLAFVQLIEYVVVHSIIRPICRENAGDIESMVKS